MEKYLLRVLGFIKHFNYIGIAVYLNVRHDYNTRNNNLEEI